MEKPIHLTNKDIARFVSMLWTNEIAGLLSLLHRSNAIHVSLHLPVGREGAMFSHGMFPVRLRMACIGASNYTYIQDGLIQGNTILIRFPDTKVYKLSLL